MKIFWGKDGYTEPLGWWLLIILICVGLLLGASVADFVSRTAPLFPAPCMLGVRPEALIAIIAACAVFAHLRWPSELSFRQEPGSDPFLPPLYFQCHTIKGNEIMAQIIIHVTAA